MVSFFVIIRKVNMATCGKYIWLRFLPAVLIHPLGPAPMNIQWNSEIVSREPHS